ncbi:hypothetical protein [Haloferax prahovense]|uniref:hypothetical protein n=1 Tax=Haloferax prahovense TaxID=381852 RepID=UPI0012DC32DD|nr:hypothetical protein [Haloferax prahovense]
MTEIGDWGFLINFLSLFIPATIGVVGSFCIYIQRQQDRELNLRKAFIAELEGSEVLRKWPIEERTIPFGNFVSMSVYEGNTNHLALLSEAETSALVHFYTQAKRVKSASEYREQVAARTESSSMNSDTNTTSRNDSLREMIDKLELFRQRALLILKEVEGSDNLPTAGDKLVEYPDNIQSIQPLLIDYSFIECDGNCHVFTESGQKFFKGNMIITGYDREADSLGRYKSPIQKTWESRYHSVKSTISGLFN